MGIPLGSTLMEKVKKAELGRERTWAAMQSQTIKDSANPTGR